LHPYFPELGAQGEWQARDKAFGDALRRATYVVTGTHVGRDEIVRFYNVDETRIHILPHPTPSFALDAAGTPSPPLTLPIPKPFVLYPAQFWSHKNHIGLIAGIATLRDRGKHVHAALVGSDKGNLEYVKARAAELGIADQVHFFGFVERDQLVALYRNAAALAYTSLCGPENLPPLEAMALGCPVINSDIAGAREQLGDAALLVDTLDASRLAEAIARVLDEADVRDELVAKGKARAARYTQREFARDMQALVDDFRRRRELWPQR
jgi:glycosyltransferase involved in cell wall biosynthesis